ncbi:MAG: hypothetical protein H0U69_13315 [Trueperaceae bacterium]|nr:hypothetical protein [Trueperaceae bacterium]
MKTVPVTSAPCYISSMRHVTAIASVLLVVVIAACAPAASIQPQERTTRLTFEQAYAEVLNVISTQPYPADASGWAITRSDQVGGFISAEMTYAVSTWLGLGTTQQTATISVTLVQRTNDTAVTVSSTNHNVARDLAARISERLGL